MLIIKLLIVGLAATAPADISAEQTETDCVPSDENPCLDEPEQGFWY